MTNSTRISTGFRAFDGLLGGGLVPGTGYVFASARGLGKTTLILQMFDAMSRASKRTVDGLSLFAPGHDGLLASAEMSTEDLILFARRVIDVDDSKIEVLGYESHGGDVYKIVEEAERAKSKVLAVDSLQTMFVDDVQADVGSAEQQKAVVNYLTSFAAATKTVVIFIAHLNREGQLSPDWTVEAIANHLGGTVCRIEKSCCTCGAMEGLSDLRVVTADRNKYGPPNRRAVLAMTERGFSDGLLV